MADPLLEIRGQNGCETFLIRAQPVHQVCHFDRVCRRKGVQMIPQAPANLDPPRKPGNRPVWVAEAPDAFLIL